MNAEVTIYGQCEPPRDVEAYIHRSGRTGRAGEMLMFEFLSLRSLEFMDIVTYICLLLLGHSGNTGIAVMLYDPKKSNISKIERESGVKFEHLSAPQPADVAKAAGKEAAEAIAEISDRYVFRLCFL